MQSYWYQEAFIDFILLEFKIAGLTESLTSKLGRDGLNFLLERSFEWQSINNDWYPFRSLNENNRFVSTSFVCSWTTIHLHCNIVGVLTAQVNVQALTFFGTVECLFTFFSCSTHRWSVCKDVASITLQGPCATRWCSKAGVVKAISTKLDEVIAALEAQRYTNWN